MQPDVSIIIVNWNTRAFLARCLEALPPACGSLSYEVCVVDNASVDGSPELVRERFPQMRMIVNTQNAGFAAANNQAAREATGRYLLLLNPDTEAKPGSIAGLVAYAEAHREIGAVGPHLLNTDGSDQRSCWRGYPWLGMAIVNALYLWKLPWVPLTWVSEYRPYELRYPRYVDHVLGACMLIRRSAWEQVGSLDESFFLGSEETDWCYRARRAGWQIAYHPEFQVVHHGERSIWQQPSRSFPRLYSGYCQFYRRHHNSKTALILLCGILALNAVVRLGLWGTRWVTAHEGEVRKGARAMISGYLEVIHQLPNELRQPLLGRVSVQPSQPLPDATSRTVPSRYTQIGRFALDVAVLRCPRCGGSLREEHQSLACDSCSACWEVRNGIPILLKHEIYWGFASQEKAKALNELAAREGWQAAGRWYARTEHPERYDYYHEYITSEARADFSILTDLTPESRVLDIGSGWGNLATGMARVAGQVYALDATYENLAFVAIRAAQEGLDNVYPVGASATDLPFADGFFDFIVMNGVLEWVGTGDTSASALDLQKQALRQAWQKLRPGGKLYVGIENRWGFMYFIGQPDPHTGLRFVTLLPRPLANLYACLLQGKPYRALTYSRSGLEKLLRQAGFAQVEFYYPVPGYQNYRFLTTFGDQNEVEFLLRSLWAFPRFSGFLYALGWTSLRLGFLPLLRQTYPSLAAIGTK